MSIRSGYCDFHCHLDDECFDENRWRLIDQCFASGLEHIVTVADPSKSASLALTMDMLARWNGMHAICGAHPHQADQYSAALERDMLDFRNKAALLAIGEVGLDYHYDFSSRENQLRALTRQVALARDLDLPLVIHSRNAEADVLALLEKEKFTLPVVFHCFTGDREAAAEIIRRGYGISLSGIITFKKADALREIAKMAPLAQLFSETDAPYLSPEPRRGETNTPLGVITVVQRIASIKELEEAQVKDAIAQNLLRLLSRN
jgi:TatD DNase family protein